MEPRSGEDGASDVESLDNWTIVDTEEADDASLYFSRTESDSLKMSEEEVEQQEAPQDEAFVPEAEPDQDEDSLVENLSESENIDKGVDSDDGVSIISESCPEDLEEQPVVEQTELSDLSSECDAPLVLGEKGEPQYKHQPNRELSLLLNTILVVTCASVAGLALGHFLGVQEECHAPLPPVGAEAWNALNVLNHENDLLKMQLKQLQNSLGDKQSSHDSILQDVGVIPTVWPEEESSQAAKSLTNDAQAAPEATSTNTTAAPQPPPVASGQQPKKQDSFFSRVEAELEQVMRRVDKDGRLADAVLGVRQWANQVHSQTTQQGNYAYEQLKKGVSRAVHQVKRAATHLNAPDGVVHKIRNSWCKFGQCNNTQKPVYNTNKPIYNTPYGKKQSEKPCYKKKCFKESEKWSRKDDGWRHTDNNEWRYKKHHKYLPSRYQYKAYKWRD